MSCGTELPPNSKFCNECGAAVTRVSRPAEYKQVTVLFADVVRSMDIAAALDVERYREIMTELVERSAAVVQRYGGTVEYTGDGVMAIFGAPMALEDHAIRACLAAVGVQEEAKRLAEEVQDRDGVDLQVRVGLNSGQVIAGEIGAGALGYAAIGEQVGLAQRMESAAPPGGVMLSESTARLVEHTATLAEPEWVRIKGADDPVRARRLVAIGPRDGLVGRAEASLIGRRLGDGGRRGHGGARDRWPRWCGECGGTAGHRQEPGGPGGCGAGGRPRGRGGVGLLRIPRQRHPVPCRDAAAAGGQRGGRP